MGKAPKVQLKRLIDDYTKYFEYSDLPDLSTAKGRKRAQDAFDEIIKRRAGNNFASSKEYVRELKEHNYIEQVKQLYSRLLSTNDLNEDERTFLSDALRMKRVREELINIHANKPGMFDNIESPITSRNTPDPQSLSHSNLTIRDLDLSPKVNTSKQAYIKRLNTSTQANPTESQEYPISIADTYDTDWMQVPDLNSKEARVYMGNYIDQKRRELNNRRAQRIQSYLPTDDIDQEEARLNTISNKYYQARDNNDWSPITEDDYKFLALNNQHKSMVDVEYRKKAVKDMRERVNDGRMTQQEFQDIINYWKKHNLTLGRDTYTKDEYKNLFN